MHATTESPSAVRHVDPRTLRAWLESGEARLVDVRERDEHARERIAAAVLVPLSGFDPAALPRDSGRLVLHCRSGRRSAEAAGRAVAAGGGEVFSLEGGIEAWKAAGLPVERSASPGWVPISIMRQVQLVIGTVVLAASLLAILVSPWFAAIAAFMGAGLLVAGASGTCGLASVIALMPWNRAFAAGCAVPRQD